MTVSRRGFIKGLIGAGALLATGGAIYRGTNETAVAEKIFGKLPVSFMQQIITRDMDKTRRIVWQLKAPVAGQIFEWREKENGEIHSVAAENASFSDDGKTFHRYTAVADSSGEFSYRVRTGDAASAWIRSSGGDKSALKSLIFPDSQSADYNVWANVAKTAARLNPDAAFFVNMGDIVDNGEATEQWNAWFDGLPESLLTVPFAPIMGNHETYNRDWKVRTPDAYLNYFPVPDNGDEKFSRYYYSFDCRDTHFVVLNTQWQEVESLAAPLTGLVARQQKWLEEDMAKNAKKWNVALLHKDVLQYRINNRPERTEGISDVGEVFMPLFTKLRFDAVLTAHLHTLRDRGHIDGFAKGAGGPWYILTGLAGDVRYPGLWVDHAFDEYVAPQPETDNFLTLEVTGNRLTIAAFLPDGRELFRRSLEK